MKSIIDALSTYFSGYNTDFLGKSEASRAIIFDDSGIIRKRYLDGGCEYSLPFKLAFRGFFGRDIAKNLKNRNEQEQLASSIISGPLPELPDGYVPLTLDVVALSTDCIDIKKECARYCVECKLIYFGEG